MVISDFPIRIKNSDKYAGKLGFINLKTKTENSDTLILGRNDPQQESFIFLDKEAQLDKLSFKNLNQEVKSSTIDYQDQYRKKGLWLQKKEAQLIKIIV
jgi:hypothetical protein